MTLEQQVCSLELAKKLKELGVKQDSYFYYALRQDGSWICSQGKGWSDSVSAFTVAELGEMLPEEIIQHSHTSEDIVYQISFSNGIHSIGYQAEVSIGNEATMIHTMCETIGKTEADARAKMIIHLIENNLIEL